MTIRELSWRRYRLPFITPFRTAHGQTTHREGLILELAAEDGRIGLGEAAPLAEFGGGDVDQAEKMLRSLAPELIGRDAGEIFPLLNLRLGERPVTSALRFAFDTALLDLESTRRGVRLADILSPNARDAVPVNATIGQADTDRAAAAAREAVAQGFQTIKLKVGIGDSMTSEVDRVAAVREAIGPRAALRLDANGAWELEQAVRVLRELTPFDIEFVEQPVDANDLEGLAAVHRSVDIRIAADEVVTSLESVRRVIAAGAADVLVIKPTVCGGLLAARQIIEMAREAGLQAVVTSSLEAGIGVAATLHLAATLPEGSPACGLATLDLLADDLIQQPLAVGNGWMELPSGPGVGVTLDDEQLDAFAVREWQYATYSSISQNSDTKSWPKA